MENKDFDKFMEKTMKENNPNLEVPKKSGAGSKTKIKSLFDDIRQEDKFGDFWYARDLMISLDYERWENFENVIQKAKESCKNSNQSVVECFRDITKTSNMPNGGTKEIQDIRLTRYACYLIAQNGDPSKKNVALAQTYFAIQTYRQEINDSAILERIEARENLTETEKKFGGILNSHGCEGKDIGDIKSRGDQALFGKRTAKLKKDLQIPDKAPLADYIDTVFIKAKDLSMAMTNYKVKRDNLQGKLPILEEHLINNTEVKNTLKQQGIDTEKDIKNIGKIPIIQQQTKTLSSDEQEKKDMVEINISKDLWKFALYVLYKNKGTLTTTQIKEEIIKLGIIPKEYFETNPKKKEPYIYQIIRNLKSNAKNKISWISQGYAEIIGKGFQITPKGIDFVKSEFKEYF